MNIAEISEFCVWLCVHAIVVLRDTLHGAPHGGHDLCGGVAQWRSASLTVYLLPIHVMGGVCLTQKQGKYMKKNSYSSSSLTHVTAAIGAHGGLPCVLKPNGHLL